MQGTVRDNIIELTRQKGWSRMRLSRESGVPYMTISDIFSGKTLEPQNGTIEWMAAALRVSVSLLYRSDMDLTIIEDEADNLLLQMVHAMKRREGVHASRVLLTYYNGLCQAAGLEGFSEQVRKICGEEGDPEVRE